MKASSVDNPFRKGFHQTPSLTGSTYTVFQCSQCQTIIGNSIFLSKIKRPRDDTSSPDKSFLLFSSLENALSFSEEIHYDQEGYFKYCTYKTIKCEFCNSALGMLFLATSPEAKQFLDCYCIIQSAILSYTLGETAQLVAAKTRQKFLKELITDSPNQLISTGREKTPLSTPLPAPPQLSMMMHPESSPEDEGSKTDSQDKYRSPAYHKKGLKEKLPSTVSELEQEMKQIHDYLVIFDDALDESQKEVNKMYHKS